MSLSVRGRRFDSRQVKSDTLSQQLARIATFLQSFVAKALNRGDEPRRNTASLIKI